MLYSISMFHCYTVAVTDDTVIDLEIVPKIIEILKLGLTLKYTNLSPHCTPASMENDARSLLEKSWPTWISPGICTLHPNADLQKLPLRNHYLQHAHPWGRLVDETLTFSAHCHAFGNPDHKMS